MTNHDLAVIGGDGIGPEVTAEALKCLSAAAESFGFEITTTDYDLSADRYLKTGHVIDEDDLDHLVKHDAILFGALGDPRVLPGVLERGLILRVRTTFEQSINLRPVRLYPGVASPIRDLTPDRCDLVIVRENSEGMYASDGQTLSRGRRGVVAIQESINTREAILNVVDFSFRLATQRKGRLALCHKTNVLTHAGRMYADAVEELSARYSDVELDYVHVDAMCQHLPLTPERFDVVVTDNLFGDIISDLGATIQGGLGVASSGNLNIDRTSPSMFEAVHGSAPDIAGTGVANPAAAILSAALLLAWMGEGPAAVALESAVAATLADQGQAEFGTKRFGDGVAEKVVSRGGPVVENSLMTTLSALDLSPLSPALS